MIGDATPMIIGGAAPGAGNVISHNSGFGVLLTGQGSGRIEANTIADNVLAGIAVATGTANRFTRNRIFRNGGLGIELAPLGVTPNDPGDADTGPNDLMNFPELLRARLRDDGLRVVGRIDTPNPETVVIELFAKPGAVAGRRSVRARRGGGLPRHRDAEAERSFRREGIAPVAPGTLISATATDAAGNTSEFAENTACRLTNDDDDERRFGRRLARWLTCDSRLAL